MCVQVSRGDCVQEELLASQVSEEKGEEEEAHQLLMLLQ